MLKGERGGATHCHPGQLDTVLREKKPLLLHLQRFRDTGHLGDFPWCRQWLTLRMDSENNSNLHSWGHPAFDRALLCGPENGAAFLCRVGISSTQEAWRLRPLPLKDWVSRLAVSMVKVRRRERLDHSHGNYTGVAVSLATVGR